jgi:hypothetical protein
MKDDNLDPRIADLLRKELAPPAFSKDEVKARVAATLRTRRDGRDIDRRWFVHPVVRTAMAAAAAVLVFVAGSEYGRRIAAANGAGIAVPEMELSAPISIQSAGSRYVASLAQFTEQAPELTAEEREEARQVALAIMYAATAELLQDQENDGLLETVARLFYSKRQSLKNPEHRDAVWF